MGLPIVLSGHCFAAISKSESFTPPDVGRLEQLPTHVEFGRLEEGLYFKQGGDEH